MSFGVETEDDFWEPKDKLSAAAIEVPDVIDHGFIHSIHAFDLNGIPIEFSHGVEGIDIRREPQMRGTVPTAVARDDAEPRPGRWPAVERPTAPGERVVYPGAGGELFHGKKQ